LSDAKVPDFICAKILAGDVLLVIGPWDGGGEDSPFDFICANIFAGDVLLENVDGKGGTGGGERELPNWG